MSIIPQYSWKERENSELKIYYYNILQSEKNAHLDSASKTSSILQWFDPKGPES